ncbi:polyadenylate-binding 1-like 2 [Labeo rohita]|uniref:Polyadenylate-binding protein 1 n=2 Tax=Labeo rohita TaxID=84645 RepID=A0ABQ8M1I9_LABRO|nr:Polyadenylate-binding protein 1 [Labeo rohita]RXN35224.1 polyadenylate-binding 1-like 2 [Labeo rohita]
MASSYNWSSCEDNGQPKDQGSLLVNDLHPEVTDQVLHTIFHPFGPIRSVKVCRDRRTDWSRGYGFVTFEQRSDAENALVALNFLELMGKPMRITWAQYMTVKVLARHRDRFAIYDAISDFGELQPRRQVCDGNGKPEENEQAEPRVSSSYELRSLLVNNLHSDVTEEELRAVFLPFGSICTTKVCRDTSTNRSHGYGFVTFEHRHNAENALAAMNFSELMGKPMFVMWGQDMTIKVLEKHSNSSFHDRHESSNGRQETDQTEPPEQSRGRRLANTVKSCFTTVMSSPTTMLGIGLLALACTGCFLKRV